MDANSQQLSRLNLWLHVGGVLPLLTGGAFYYYAVHTPLHEQRAAAAQRAASLQAFLEKSPNITREFAEANTRIKETQQRAEIVRQQIPEDPREAEFMRHINDAAAEEGVDIHNYTHGQITASATYSQMEVQLQCAGKYTEICGFLDRIANSPRAATVTRLQITAAPDAESYPLHLTLGLYFGSPKPTTQPAKASEG